MTESSTDNIKVDLDYDKLFAPMVLCLKICGCFPAEKRPPSSIMHFASMHGLYTMYLGMLCYSLYSYDIYSGDMINLFANGSYAVVYGVISLNYFSMINHQKIFFSMMNITKRDYANGIDLLPRDKKILIKYAKEGRLIVLGWMFICLSYFFVSGIIPLLYMLYLAIFDEFRVVQVIVITLPSRFDDVGVNLKISIAVAMCTYYMWYSIVMYIAVVPVGIIYMLHACGRIDILKNKILDLFVTQDSTEFEMIEMIKEIAIELQNIYDFVEDIKVSTKLSYEVTLRGSPVIIPITIFILMCYTDSSIRWDSVFLLAGALAICSLPCYYGTVLKEKDLDLREAVYISGWERVWDKRTRKSLLILMTRTERSIAIRSVFRVMSLESLTDVFRQAYTLLGVMNAASDL